MPRITRHAISASSTNGDSRGTKTTRMKGDDPIKFFQRLHSVPLLLITFSISLSTEAFAFTAQDVSQDHKLDTVQSKEYRCQSVKAEYKSQLKLTPRCFQLNNQGKETGIVLVDQAAAEQIVMIQEGLVTAVLGQDESDPDPALPPKVLSASELYIDNDISRLNPKCREFAPRYPLWTDGSIKTRWICLPDQGKIDVTSMDNWVFPVGTIFFKRFSFPKDGQVGGEAVPVETRRIHKIAADQWSFTAYQWNAERTDAPIADADGVQDAYPTAPDGSTSHDIPSLRQCIRCHSRGGERILGFDAVQIARGVDDIVKPQHYSITQLIEEDRINPYPNPSYDLPMDGVNADTAKLARKAIGYAHGNCSHCHNPMGEASFSQLFMRVELENVFNYSDLPMVKTAVNLETRFPIPGVPQTEVRRIAPGYPAKSVIPFRMRQLDFNQMPPLGREVIDLKGIEAMEAWIKAL